MRVAEAIREPVEHMDDGTRGFLRVLLEKGPKKVSEYDEDTLKEIGRETTVEDIAYLLNETFSEGFGITDALRGLDDNYGKQLEETIHFLLEQERDKSFFEHVPKYIPLVRHVVDIFKEKNLPPFEHPAETIEGIKERERWIVEYLTFKGLEKSLSPEEKIALIESLDLAEDKKKQILDALKRGHTLGRALRTVLKFDFHIYAAKLANALAKLLMGRGLSLGTNALLQKLLAKAFPMFGVVGWIDFLLDIPKWINKREWDKYITAVFIIGSERMALEEEIEEQANLWAWIIGIILLILILWWLL